MKRYLFWAMALLLIACSDGTDTDTAETDPHAGHDHAATGDDHDDHDHGLHDVQAMLDNRQAPTSDLATLTFDQLEQLGVSKISTAAWNEGAAAFGAAIDKDSTRVEGWYGLAFCLSEQGAYDLALHYFSKAAEIDDSYRETLSNLGLCKVRMGQPDEGIADLNTSLERDSECVGCYLNRALAYQITGETEKACADLSSAMELGSEDAKQLYANNCAEDASE